MITEQNVTKITREFNRLFPGDAVKYKDKLANGGYESMSCLVYEINQQQLAGMHYLAAGVPNRLLLKRSGVGIKICFS